jgi:competence ComEA-like helix-hairpin-helix protein
VPAAFGFHLVQLDEAGRALKSAEHQLREAEARAESAESKLGAVDDEDLKKANEEREGRFRALEERIKSVTDRASGAQAHAASVGIELPERDEAEVAEPEPEPEVTRDQPTDEQEAVEPAPERLGFLGRRRARRAEKAAAKEQAAAEEAAAEAKAAVEREAAERKAEEQRKKDEEEKEAAGKKETQAKRASKATRSRRRGGLLDLNKATFEQLREVGLSVTQATRVIAYRERKEGFASVDDLETVPGIPKKLLNEIRDQLTA